MRSVFTVEIPQNDEGIKYPDTSEIINYIRAFGWEPVEVRSLENDIEKGKRYKVLAEQLFKDMPEIANEEKNDVIFFGYLSDDQTKFVITRRVEGQITFRLLHPDLPRLQLSSARMIKKIINSRFNNKPLGISNQSIVIYERGFDRIILNGRVIPNAGKETYRVNKKDTLLFLIPIALFAITIPVIQFINSFSSPNQLVLGTLERFNTALLTTSVVSFLGLVQTFLEIRNNRLIAWNFLSLPTS